MYKRCVYKGMSLLSDWIDCKAYRKGIKPTASGSSVFPIQSARGVPTKNCMAVMQDKEMTPATLFLKIVAATQVPG